MSSKIVIYVMTHDGPTEDDADLCVCAFTL